jgi:hypothetical protein
MPFGGLYNLGILEDTLDEKKMRTSVLEELGEEEEEEVVAEQVAEQEEATEDTEEEEDEEDEEDEEGGKTSNNIKNNKDSNGKRLIVVRVQDSYDLRTQIIMDLFIVAMGITPFSYEGAVLFALCHHMFSYFFCRQANY